MLSKLIADNYRIELNSLKHFDEQNVGADIYLAQTNNGKYIVKVRSEDGMKNEGHIAEFVYNNGIPAAKFLKTKSGDYHVKTEDYQFHVQELVDGEVLDLNTAPEWFLEKSSGILGKIHSALKDYAGLPAHFDGGFFSKSTTDERKAHFAKLLEEAKDEQASPAFISLYKKRLKHLERISAFDIDADKLTYSNSHGDFYILQAVVKNQDITVIDWTNACRLPICDEVIRSYIFASPKCKDGKIDSDRLKRYVSKYSKHFHLNDYDIQIMPHLYYYKQMICNYTPYEIYYGSIPDSWKAKSTLIANISDWLYENVEMLARDLKTV